MSNICEHEFEQEDSQNKGYSMTEYDLYAKLDMTIRKNLRGNIYEIVRISSGDIIFSGTLEEVVRKANELEGEENTKISCQNIFCGGRE